MAEKRHLLIILLTLIITLPLTVLFAAVTSSPQVMGWLGFLASSFIPKTPFSLFAVALTVMLALTADALERPSGTGALGSFLSILFFVVILFLLVAVNIDLIPEMVWTTKVSAVFAKVEELNLGVWRVLCLAFATGFLFFNEEGWNGFKGGLSSLGLLLALSLVNLFVGEAIVFLVKPVGNPSAVADGLWTVGRYLALGSACTLASLTGLFTYFLQHSIVTYADAMALIATGVCFFASVTLVSCGGYAFDCWLHTYRARKDAQKWRTIESPRGPLSQVWHVNPTDVFEENGLIQATVNLRGPSDGKALSLRLMVDTGATHTKISAKKLKRLGVKPHSKIVEVLADGRKAKRDIGYAYMECLKNWAFVPVVFGKEGDVEVLGMSAIKQLGIMETIFKIHRRKTPDLESGTTVQELAPFRSVMFEDGEKARDEAVKAGLVGVHYGLDPHLKSHIFFLLPPSIAESLVKGEAVVADEQGREVFERLCALGYLARDDGFYRLKSEDLRKDLEVQLSKLKEHQLKRTAGYIV